MKMHVRHTVTSATIENPTDNSAERKKAVWMYVLPQTMDMDRAKHLSGLTQRALSNGMKQYG